MAHGALSSMAERKGVFSFLHAFYFQTHLFSTLQDFSGYLGNTAKVYPSGKICQDQERGTFYIECLKTPALVGKKNEWAREIEPLGCGIGAWRAGQVKDALLNRQALSSCGKTSQKPLSGNSGEW